MKDKTKPKVKLPKKKMQLPDKKLKMHIKLILSTLHQTMKNCETYDEFKEFINFIFKDEVKNDLGELELNDNQLKIKEWLEK